MTVMCSIEQLDEHMIVSNTAILSGRGDANFCQTFVFVLPLLALVVLSGCSSLMADPRARQQQLDSYITQTEPLLFYYPGSLQLDEQLRVLGMENIGEPLVHGFASTQATRGMMEQFIAAVPQLSGNATRIVEPAQWDTVRLSPDTPVMFFHVSWKMNYQRLPPQFRMYRLQMGTIAKVIPLGQVLSRKGTIAASTAAWEGMCHFEAYSGQYFSVDEWLADDAVRLVQGITAAQEACVQKLAADFPRIIGVGTKQ